MEEKTVGDLVLNELEHHEPFITCWIPPTTGAADMSCINNLAANVLSTKNSIELAEAKGPYSYSIEIDINTKLYDKFIIWNGPDNKLGEWTLEEFKQLLYEIKQYKKISRILE